MSSVSETSSAPNPPPLPLPTVRLTVTPAEFSLLKPGLEFLACGLATANLGNFPDRYAGADGLFRRLGVYRDRAYDEEHAHKLISVRAKLWELAVSRKVRLDIFELSAAALALRFHGVATGVRDPSDGLKVLAKKLELYRRRALRSALSKFGQPTYSNLALRWTRFVRWIRFNLTPPPPRRTELASSKRHWAEQRSALQALVMRTLQTRCYAPLTDPEMQRMVRLLKEEFRRGRHPVRLRELLRNDEGKSEEMLFQLLQKKAKLKALPGAKLDLSQMAAARGEKFRHAELQRRALAWAPKDEAPLNPDIPPVPPLVEVPSSLPVATGLPATAPPSQPTETDTGKVEDFRYTEIDLAARVAEFLSEHVPSNLWATLWPECLFQITWIKPPEIRVHSSVTTLSDLIRETTPVQEPEDRFFVQAELVFFSTWLLNWVRALCPDPKKAMEAVQNGFRAALGYVKPT